MRVGLREANQRFSALSKAVRRGREVLFTERGRPLARIVPVRAEKIDAVVKHFEDAGLLRASRKSSPMPACKAYSIRGGAVARTVAEERETD